MNNTVSESTEYMPHPLMFGFDRNRYRNLGQEGIIPKDREQIAERAKQRVGFQSKKMKKQFEKM